MYEDCVDNTVSYIEIKFGVNTEMRAVNFGSWCIYDKKTFCQEREGCSNCCIALRDGAPVT
jgi:hypothetical protein